MKHILIVEIEAPAEALDSVKEWIKGVKHVTDVKGMPIVKKAFEKVSEVLVEFNDIQNVLKEGK